MRKFLLFLFAGTVAAAGAGVYAAEPNIASESELLGIFGTDDSSVFDNFDDFLDDVSGTGMDFIGDDFPDVSLDEEGVDGYTVSGNIPFDIDFFSSYDTYYGSIGSTYLEYMRGFLPKLRYNQHYVASRVSQYDYIFAYGRDLEFSGDIFTGTNITVVTWNTRNNGSYGVTVDDSFSLDPGSFLVYSDLSVIYPTLADLSGFTMRQLLILFCIFFLCLTIEHMYQVRKIRRLGGK